MVRSIATVVVVAVVAGGAYFYFFAGKSTKSVTADFTSGVGLYVGTPVRILGIQVGQVTSVKPEGATVQVKMNYASKYKVPAGAGAVIVANSLVSDRYIQLTPVYPGQGAVMANGHEIHSNLTSSPAELDDIYAALNKLSVDLGPTGANKGGTNNGALNTLVEVAAANLKGNGASLGNSIQALSAAAGTLAKGRNNLAGTVQNLAKFTQTLSNSDAQVQHFENQLAQVAGDLADERSDLGAALHNLGVALNSVAGFIRDNASKIHTDVGGLKTLTGLLVKEQSSLNETLAVAPVALANLVHTYQSPPNSAPGTLGTRSNLASLTSPDQICGALNTLGGLTGSLLGNLTQKVTDQVVAACKAVGGTSGLGGLPVIGGLTGLLGVLPGVN